MCHCLLLDLVPKLQALQGSPTSFIFTYLFYALLFAQGQVAFNPNANSNCKHLNLSRLGMLLLGGFGTIICDSQGKLTKLMYIIQARAAQVTGIAMVK